MDDYWLYYEFANGVCHDCHKRTLCSHLAESGKPTADTCLLGEIFLCAKCMEKRFGGVIAQRGRFEWAAEHALGEKARGTDW